MLKKIFGLILVLFLSACSITQTVEPVEINDKSKLCVVDNPKVKDGFLIELESVLKAKKIAYSVVDRETADNECEWKVMYTANWAWDLAVYMTYAKITVYQNGDLRGEAEYDSRMGGSRLDKFINANEKVRELVTQLMQKKQAFLFMRRSYG